MKLPRLLTRCLAGRPQPAAGATPSTCRRSTVEGTARRFTMPKASAAPARRTGPAPLATLLGKAGATTEAVATEPPGEPPLRGLAGFRARGSAPARSILLERVLTSAGLVELARICSKESGLFQVESPVSRDDAVPAAHVDEGRSCGGAVRESAGLKMLDRRGRFKPRGPKSRSAEQRHQHRAAADQERAGQPCAGRCALAEEHNAQHGREQDSG